MRPMKDAYSSMRGRLLVYHLVDRTLPPCYLMIAGVSEIIGAGLPNIATRLKEPMIPEHLAATIDTSRDFGFMDKDHARRSKASLHADQLCPAETQDWDTSVLSWTVK